MGASETRAVFLTEHVEDGRKLVVQMLQPSASTVERASFLDHAARIRRLAHPHIIQTIDVGCDGDAPYVVYEHLQGVSLATELQRGPSPLRRAVHIARQVAAALGAAHVEGILHGGLGPDSVFLVERDGDQSFVKLLGFGAGDRPYVPAPEQVLGGELDERGDVWAVGALLYRMLTGHGPFAGAPGSPAWRKQIIEGDPVELLRTDVPHDLRAVIQRCLAKDPSERYEDMAELVAALAPFERRFPRGSQTLAPPIVNPEMLRSDEPIVVIPPPAPYLVRRTYWHLIVIGVAVLGGCIFGALIV